MKPAIFEWDDENIEHIAMESTLLKLRQCSTIDHSFYELKTISTSPTDSQMRVAIYWSFLLASLRAFGSSVLVT